MFPTLAKFMFLLSSYLAIYYSAALASAPFYIKAMNGFLIKEKQHCVNTVFFFFFNDWPKNSSPCFREKSIFLFQIYSKSMQVTLFLSFSRI